MSNITELTKNTKNAVDGIYWAVRNWNIEKDMVRAEEPYFILKRDGKKRIYYCSTCWGNDHRLVQMYYDGRCLNCMNNHPGFEVDEKNLISN